MRGPMKRRLDALWAWSPHLSVMAIALLTTFLLGGGAFAWGNADLALMVLLSGAGAIALALLWMDRRKIWAEFFGKKEDE